MELMITTTSTDLELESAVKLLKIWFIQVPTFTLPMGGILYYLASNRSGLSTWIGLIRSCILFVPILYIFSAVSMNDPSSLNAELSEAQISNPYYNNAMWFFLWSTPVAYLSANLVVLIMSACYIIFMSNTHHGTWLIANHLFGLKICTLIII